MIKLCRKIVSVEHYDFGNKLYLTHCESVFEQAKECYATGRITEKEIIPVVNEKMEYLYSMQYFPDKVYCYSKYGTECSIPNEYKSVPEERMDFNLLDRADHYFIDELEEYTYHIAKIIKKHYPKKRIVFKDYRAKFFFDYREIEIVSSFYEFNNARDKVSSYMYICSDGIGAKKNKIPEFVINIYDSLNVMTSLYWSYKIRKFGPLNPDKTFLLIDQSTGKEGLSSIIKMVFSYCMIAEQRGMIPVVDLNKLPNQYLQKRGENMWYYYFKQISKCNLEQVYQSVNVISGSDNHFEDQNWANNPYINENYCYMAETIRNKDNIVHHMLKFNENIMTCLFEQLPAPFKAHRRILGVIARGSDYRNESFTARTGNKKNSNMDLENLINVTKIIFMNKKYEYIYLATEEEEYLSAFEQEFGDKLIYSQQKRVSYSYEDMKDKLLTDYLEIEDGKAFGQIYLAIIWNLSLCNALISSINAGTRLIAQGLNQGKYELDIRAEKDYVIDLK